MSEQPIATHRPTIETSRQPLPTIVESSKVAKVSPTTPSLQNLEQPMSMHRMTDVPLVDDPELARRHMYAGMPTSATSHTPTTLSPRLERNHG
jgi:hypothetical protein